MARRNIRVVKIVITEGAGNHYINMSDIDDCLAASLGVQVGRRVVQGIVAGAAQETL